MSEIKQQMSDHKFDRTILPSASNISNDALEDFPNIYAFFELLVRDAEINFKQFGNPFRYRHNIMENRYYSYHDIFVDYFIRKHLSKQFDIELKDDCTECILENPDDYIIGNKNDLHKDIQHHYEIFKNPNTKAMDILKSIKIVSLSHSIFFGNGVPSSEVQVNKDNLREVIKYLKNLLYTTADLNPTLNCEYFNADATVIFDNGVIWENKSSKYFSRTHDNSNMPKSTFFELIINAFGFYKNTGKMIKKFKIYIPLWGHEYSMELDNIDFERFEKILEKDINVYCRFNKFKKENMYLDLTLFTRSEIKQPILTKKESNDEPRRRFLPNATHITNEALENFPNIKHFFELLVKDSEIDIKQIGGSFKYSKSIEKNRYYSYYGLFMDYFIRKHLSNQYDIEIKDDRTEYILENADDYIIGTNDSLRNAIIKHYEIFKDPNTKAMDIIKSVKVVSLSHSIFFRENVPTSELHVNEDTLREVIKYLESLPYKIVDLNPSLYCEYFNADADLIFDNDVVYEIKTSKFISLTSDETTIPKSKFYQTIIYGFGFYKKTGKMIKKFKIYNPLLGYEYSMELNDIDYELFEKVLDRDVDAHCRYWELKEENVDLDLTLFPEIENNYIKSLFN